MQNVNVWTASGQVLKVDQYGSFIFGRLMTEEEAVDLDAMIAEQHDEQPEEEIAL